MDVPFSASRRCSLLRVAAVLCFAVAAGGSPRPAEAHPHVFVDAAVRLEAKASQIVRIGMTWKFDSLFTEGVMQDFDADGDGSFGAKELPKLRKGAFDNLKNYGYFTALELDGIRIPTPAATNFSARYDRGEKKISYTFSLPVRIRPKPAGSTLKVALYDTSYFVDIQPLPERSAYASLAGDGSLKASFAQVTEKVDSDYWGECGIRKIFVRLRGNPS
jgi:ABC-type uncharacterized transport system substrate-binding protein